MVFVNWVYGQVGSRHGVKMSEIILVEVERFVWAHRLRGFSRRLLGLMLWADVRCCVVEEVFMASRKER